MKYIALGLLLGLFAAFPHLAVLAAAPAVTAGLWTAGQPAAWAFLAGLTARTRLPRRPGAHTPGRAR